MASDYPVAAGILVAFFAVGALFAVYGYLFSKNIVGGRSKRLREEHGSPLIGMQKRAMIEGFRSGRVIWTGRFREDYLFFFANENIRAHIIFGGHHSHDPAPYFVKLTIFVQVMIVNYILGEIASAESVDHEGEVRGYVSWFVIYGYACLTLLIYEKIIETVTLSEPLRALVKARHCAFCNGYGVGMSLSFAMSGAVTYALQCFLDTIFNRMNTGGYFPTVALWAISQLAIGAFLMMLFSVRFAEQHQLFHSSETNPIYPYPGYPTIPYFETHKPPPCNHRGCSKLCPCVCPTTGLRMSDDGEEEEDHSGVTELVESIELAQPSCGDFCVV
jgi:hypothetical protein